MYMSTCVELVGRWLGGAFGALKAGSRSTPECVVCCAYLWWPMCGGPSVYVVTQININISVAWLHLTGYAAQHRCCAGGAKGAAKLLVRVMWSGWFRLVQFHGAMCIFLTALRAMKQWPQHTLRSTACRVSYVGCVYMLLHCSIRSLTLIRLRVQCNALVWGLSRHTITSHNSLLYRFWPTLETILVPQSGKQQLSGASFLCTVYMRRPAHQCCWQSTNWPVSLSVFLHRSTSPG